MSSLGPNMKKLIAHKMSIDAIPSGGGVADALKFLTTPGSLGDGWKKAKDWVDAALTAIRSAEGLNPWKEAHDETIAGYLLEQIEAKKRIRSNGPV